MHLRSISLKGFKSFPDRTRLEFAPGVSVVVGPNGSGKSNITDAVLWALGEQSPLAVRGQTMQDVIFAGGHGLPSRSSAEVEVVIDNSDGTLESPFSELSIVRKLDRSGEGEYRLNGARCRLADVVEALSDSGLGKEMHSVVSQGRVEAIIHSKPRDRRLMIEEAAGLGKHRRRRRRAHLKLERTSENLSRALDVEREARSRLRPLKRQAEAAELHERLERQSLEARLELARESVRLSRRELSGAEKAASSSRELRDGAEAELAEVAGRRERAEEAFAEHSRVREALSSAAWGARAASDAISIRLERAGDTRAEAEARAERRRAELIGLETGGAAETAASGRLEELESELASLDSETDEQDGPEDHIAAARARHGQAVRALRELRAAGGEGARFVEAAEAALDRVADAITAAEALALAAGEGARSANDARAAERALQRAQLEAEIRAERRFAEEGERGRAARLEHVRARLTSDERLASASALAAGALQAAFEAVEARREHLHAELAADEETGARTAAELKACAQGEAELQARLRELSEGVTSTEVRAQQLRDAEAEASNELNEIARALGVEPETSQKALPEDEREQLEARVARLARRREQLGPVNPLAKTEYDEAVEHVGDLERQRDDLESAIRELERLIRETDRRIRESFEQTFEQAARNFEELVEHLFPGGRGRLRLVMPEGPRPVIGGEPADGEGSPAVEAEAEDDEDPPADEPGVEVEVTPAGKATKRLSLLSGGEKSLVALAFMFAVFLARPCPFYILDEVEAALDDLNIDRFLQLLRRYSDRAQFIVVTHQKRTMDAADCLYGVSMGKDGVSKVVSRRLAPGEDALEAVDGDGAEEAA